MLRTPNAQPLTDNRSLESKSKTIARGKACLSCRQKKLKCDGLAPACSKCQFKSLPCQYGDNSKESRVSSKQIRLLEHKLALLKQQVQEMGINELSDGSSPNEFLLGELTLDFPQDLDDSPDFWAPLEGFAQPTQLPATSTLRSFVASFFATICPSVTIMCHNSIYNRLALARSHRNYPGEHFLHSIVALGVLIIGRKLLKKEAHLQFEYMQSGLSPEEWHAEKCSHGVQQAFNKAVESKQWEKALDCIRANILFIQYLNRRGLHFRLWYHTGIGSQMSRQLELHLLPWKRKILPPAESDALEWERNMIFWWTIMDDKVSTTMVGILPQLDDSLIEVPIASVTPNLLSSLDESRLTRALDIHNPLFYTTHPPDLVGDLQFFFKISILMSRSISISQRKATFADYPTKSGLNDFDRRNSLDFICLERDISSFLESINTYPFTASEKRSIMSSCANFALITIHEDFITSQEGDISLMKVLNASDKIYSSMFSNSDSIVLPDVLQLIAMAWEGAARTFLRVLALREALNHPTGELEEKVLHIVDCLKSFKDPVLFTSAAYLLYLMNNRQEWIEPDMKINPAYHHLDWRVK